MDLPVPNFEAHLLDVHSAPSQEKTYPTYERGKLSSQLPFKGICDRSLEDMLWSAWTHSCLEMIRTCSSGGILKSSLQLEGGRINYNCQHGLWKCRNSKCSSGFCLQGKDHHRLRRIQTTFKLKSCKKNKCCLFTLKNAQKIRKKNNRIPLCCKKNMVSHGQPLCV